MMLLEDFDEDDNFLRKQDEKRKRKVEKLKKSKNKVKEEEKEKKEGYFIYFFKISSKIISSLIE